MSHPVPPQPSQADAARSDPPPVPLAGRTLPEFLPHVPPPGPHTPIEREIERSERASAALAAARALARASFTDSQLAADDAAGDAAFDSSGWVRTEYAALEHPVRHPDDDAARSDAPRNLVGGSFNPGIATLQGRAFPGASIADSPIKTRTGAQARFQQESRRTERVAPASAKIEPAPAAGAGHDDKAAAVRTSARSPTPARAPAGESFKVALAAGVGAIVVLIGGGVALKAGVLSHGDTPAIASVAARAAAPIQAAALPPSTQEIAVTPAAGTAPTRSAEDVDAALAAAARAAAVPVASVHAAGPSRAARPEATLAPTARPTVASTLAAASAPHARDSVAAAIANAQARADRFLATDGAAPVAEPTSEVKPAQ